MTAATSLLVQVLVSAALAAAVFFGVGRLARGRSAPRAVLALGRTLRILAVVTPILLALAATLVPEQSRIAPLATVWTGPTGQTEATILDSTIAVAIPADTPSLRAPPALVAAIWLAGFAVVLTRRGRDIRAVHTVVDGAVTIKHIGRVQLRASDAITIPFAWRRHGDAIVVVPPHLLLDPDATLLAVRHELQHHRQGDPWHVHLDAVWDALCWCAPLAHRWTTALREWEELACDAALVHDRHTDADRYARLLLTTARAAKALASPAPALVGRPAALLTRRVQMLFLPRPPRRADAPLILVGAMAVSVVSTAALAASAGVLDTRVDRALAADAAARIQARSDFPAELTPLVEAQLDRMVRTAKGRRALTVSLERAVPLMDDITAAAERWGVPPEVAAIPIVESRFQNMDADAWPSATFEADTPWRGAGLWMFIPSTAREYGMTVGPEQDDRLDIAMETDAAMHLLRDLHDQSGDWAFALQAYNQGPRATREGLKEAGTQDVLQAAQGGHVNEYTAMVIAAAILAEEPALWGGKRAWEL